MKYNINYASDQPLDVSYHFFNKLIDEMHTNVN